MTAPLAERTRTRHEQVVEEARTAALPATVDVLVVGAGFAGLGLAVQLKEAGFEVLVVDRGDDVGGTWRDNTYPGCACDVESHLYSLSFAPNPTWSHVFSPQPEIHAYLQDVAHRFDLWPHLRLSAELQDAHWDSTRGRWEVTTSRGPVSARVLSLATGAFSAPKLPALPGLEGFPGPVLHTGRWDHDVDLAGKRVAVVGTGASAIQVVPAIAPVTEHLVVLQRTAPWIVPRLDRPHTAQELDTFARKPSELAKRRRTTYWTRELLLPAYLDPGQTELMAEVALGHLHDQVKDPVLREQLTPTYQIGCKRVLLSNEWYPTLQRDDVTLVPAALERLEGSTLVAADGSRHEVDALVLATGFDVTEPPVAKVIRGRDGRTLAEGWEETGIVAHQGLTVHGFPNAFVVAGPNTGIGHTSAIVMMEAQFAQVVAALQGLRERGKRVLEVTRAAQDRWTAEIDLRSESTVWTAGGCASWYLDRHGRNSTLWPGFTWRFRRRLRKFQAADFVLEG